MTNAEGNIYDGKLLLQEAMQFARRRSRLLLRNNVANQTFFARHILAHDNDSLAHRSVRRERSLDLCRFDTIAAYLDLFIGASAKLYATVRPGSSPDRQSCRAALRACR